MGVLEQFKKSLSGADAQFKQPGNGKCTSNNTCTERFDVPLDGLKVPLVPPADAAKMQKLQSAVANSPNGEVRFKGLWKGNEEALLKAVLPAVNNQIQKMQTGVPNGHVSVDIDKLKLKTDGKTITVLDGDAAFTDDRLHLNAAGAAERLKQAFKTATVGGANLRWKQPGNNMSSSGRQALEQFDVRLDGVSFPCAPAPTSNQQQALDKAIKNKGAVKFNGDQVWSTNEVPLQQAVMGAVADYIKKQNPGVAVPDVDCFVDRSNIKLQTDGKTIKILKGEVTCTR